MKTNSIIKLTLFLAGFSVVALTGSAQAQVVINGQLGDGSNSLNGIPNGSTVAPLAYSGTTWNELGLGDTTTALLNSTGGSSGVTYAVGGGSFAATQNGGAPLQLLTTYSYNSSIPATLNFSGLNNADTYTIVVAGVGSGLDDAISITGYGSQSTHAADYGSSSFILDGNYVEFLDVAPTSGSIVVSVGPGPAANAYYALDGFQIQTNVPVVVPEPSSTALLLLGAGCLGFLMVRRAKGSLSRQ